MGNKTNILVKRGARFILDGGVIESCSGIKWDGIKVEGNSQLSQTTNPNGGLDFKIAKTRIKKMEI